jgi:hypothetical protein
MLGFQAALESLTADRAVIVTPTCPLRPLVLEEPAVRELDQGMWRGLVARALGETAAARIRCETHGCLTEESPCRIVISLRPPRGARAA